MHPFLIVACIYVSGVVLYSALFIISDNHSPPIQIAKILVAALHCLVIIVPVYLAQSRRLLLRILGYTGLAAYFAYVFFLIGFFPYFGFVPELYAYGAAHAMDLGEVSDHYFAQIFGYREVVLLVTCAAVFYLIPRHRVPLGALVFLLLPVGLYSATSFKFGTLAQSETFGNATLLRRFGLAGFSFVSVMEWLELEGDYLAAETPFPGKVADLVQSDQSSEEPFATLPQAASRVILIQIESFDPEAIEAELSGIAVMPFVSGLKSKCLNYTNFFTMKAAGGSSDSEFAVATGLIPSARLPSLRQADFTRVQTLYDSLRAAGVVSKFAHNNHAGFYNRHIAYQRMDSVTAEFLGPHEAIDEKTFAEQSLARTLAQPEKAFHYFFNFKSHGPYQGYSDRTRDRFSIGMIPGLQVNYLATMSEVDQMIESLFALQRDGFDRGENVFILTADHPSGVHTGTDKISRTRIPAIICHESFAATDISTVFGTIDLYPTILELFGVSGDGDVLGQSMFRRDENAVLSPHGALIYRDANGDVISTSCKEQCDRFMDYTDQHIMLGP